MGAMADGGVVLGSASASGLAEQLRHASEAVSARAKEAACASFEQPVRRLHQAAERVGLAWCGSWLPGMANLYGQMLQPHAASARRAAERNIDRIDMDDDADGDSALGGSGRIGWVEWSPEAIRDSIHQAAGQPEVQQLLSHAARAAQWFDEAKVSCLTTLALALHDRPGDNVLRDLQRDVQQLRVTDHDTLLDSWRPATKPLRARGGAVADVGLDWDVPAHLSELAAIEAVRSPVACLLALAGLMRRAAEHGKALLQAERAAMASRPTAFADNDSAPLLHHLMGEGARQRRAAAGVHAR